MLQNCSECKLISEAKKGALLDVIRIYENNSRYSALTILSKIIKYCKSVN